MAYKAFCQPLYHKNLVGWIHSSTFKPFISKTLRYKKKKIFTNKIINNKTIPNYLETYNDAEYNTIITNTTFTMLLVSMCSVRFCPHKDMHLPEICQTLLHVISWSITIWQKLVMTLSHLAGMCNVYQWYLYIQISETFYTF